MNKNQEITKPVKKEMEAGILMPVRKQLTSENRGKIMILLLKK